MALLFQALAALTDDEISACGEYQVDATYIHACAQGWSGQFSDSEKFQAFLGRCFDLIRHLDAAINKFEMTTNGVVYSGHGLGISVLGSLKGAPSQYLGFSYSYPGFISTSEDRSAAENFLRTRSIGARMPVLLEIRLKAAQKILPFGCVTNHVGEAEILLPRGAEFAIVEANMIGVSEVEQDVLQLTLEQRSKGERP